MIGQTDTSFARIRLFILPWLWLISAMGVGGWSLSLIGQLAWLGPLGMTFYAALAFFYFSALRQKETTERRLLLAPLAYLPFLFVSLLIVAAGVFHPPTQLDSLSYRLPRIFMWLQEGGLYFIPTADQRMNYMTPLWELNTLPFFALLGDRGFWIINLLAWAALWVLLADLAEYFAPDPKRARPLALLVFLSSFAVLQAPSTMNDLFAALFLLLSAVLILRFQQRPNGSDVAASGLALAVCGGTKLHYAVFALPWLVWFVFDPGRPWRCLPWRWTPILVPAVLVVSPLPTLLSNQIHFGSIKGDLVGDALQHGGPVQNMAVGSFVFLWQAAQPPLNPLAGWWNANFSAFTQSSGLAELAPRFTLPLREVLTVDGASFGAVTFFAILLGILLAFRSEDRRKRALIIFATCGVLAFLVAVSMIAPATIGRSFLGMGMLATPLAMLGLTRLSARTLAGGGYLALLSAIAVLVLSPAHPLWPAKTAAVAFERAGWSAPARAIRDRYLAFGERYYAGDSLLALLPPQSVKISAAVVGDQSLLQLWQPDRHKRILTFIPITSSLPAVLQGHPDYILTIGQADPERFDQLFSAIENSPDLEKVGEETFLSKLKRGSDPWKLYRVSDAQRVP